MLSKKGKKAVETDPLLNASMLQHTSIEFCASIRKLLNSNPNIGKAAFLIRDVIVEGRTIDTNWTYNPYDPDTSAISKKFSMFCRTILSSSSIRNLVHGIAWLLVILSFIEDPGWCRKLEGGCDHVLSQRGVPAFGEDGEVNVEYYPNYGLNWLSSDQSMCVEWVCAVVLVIYIVLLIGRDGFVVSKFLRHSTGVQIYRLILILSVLCLIAGLVFGTFYDAARPLALYARLAILITFSDNIQRELKNVAMIVPAIGNLLFLLFLIVAFYAWAGNTMLFGTKEGTTYFPTLVEGMYTLFICVTTSNYPDVMMFEYNRNRAVNIYFISFMVIAFYFVMNVILSSVVNSYTNSGSEHEENRMEKVKSKMQKAFKLLDPDGVGSIGRMEVMAVFRVLNDDCPEVPHIDDDKAEILFALVDQDGSSTIDKDEFMHFSKVMLIEFKRHSVQPIFIEKYFPHTFESTGFKKLSAFVTSDMFEQIIDVIVFLNAIVVFIQTFPELSGESLKRDPKIADGELDTVWEALETLFTVVYCIEMFLKLLVNGWRRYVGQFRNIFDGLITILALLATVYVYYPNTFSNSLLIRYIVMARTLRLVRLLIAIRQFQLTGEIFLGLLPAASRVFLLLFTITYFFSAIAMQCFGGLITRDPNNPTAYLLEGTSFADNFYWANSFNDMMSGMNVLFNLLLVNNWPEEADGIVAVSGTKLSRFFFILFYICGVIIVNNVVVGFVIDTFMNEFEKAKSTPTRVLQTSESNISSDRNISATEDQAIFDVSEITGTKTNIEGQFVVNFRNANKKQQVRESFFRGLLDADMKNDHNGGSVA